MQFNAPSSWLTQPIYINIVGAGGNGSHMLDGLVTLHFSLLELGHPYGIRLKMFDDDDVSHSNIARAQFYPQDIGHNKAVVLINRVNQFYNLDWTAIPDKFSHQHLEVREVNPIVITCVDTRSARRQIHEALKNLTRDSFWLDLGNADSYGNVVFGQPKNRKFKKSELRLPCVVELFPEMNNPELDAQDDAPSCSVMESLERQSMFINKAVSTFALYLLASLLKDGVLSKLHGYFINMAQGYVSPLLIDNATWKRMAKA